VHKREENYRAMGAGTIIDRPSYLRAKYSKLPKKFIEVKKLLTCSYFGGARPVQGML
jgi:hypothetical protein